MSFFLISVQKMLKSVYWLFLCESTQKVIEPVIFRNDLFCWSLYFPQRLIIESNLKSIKRLILYSQTYHRSMILWDYIRHRFFLCLTFLLQYFPQIINALFTVLLLAWITTANFHTLSYRIRGIVTSLEWLLMYWSLLIRDQVCTAVRVLM